MSCLTIEVTSCSYKQYYYYFVIKLTSPSVFFVCFLRIYGSHVFSCNNICQVPRKLFEHEVAGWVFRHLPWDRQILMQWNKRVIAILAFWYHSIEKCHRKCLENACKSIAFVLLVCHKQWHHSAKIGLTLTLTKVVTNCLFRGGV